MIEIITSIFMIMLVGAFVLGWTAAMAGVIFEMGVRSFEFVNEKVEGESWVDKVIIWVAIIYLIILFMSGAFT
tara:strand:+ start:562 stop:780 length:219 start_codon:yes stop_codon:yes gene_type:complete